MKSFLFLVPIVLFSLFQCARYKMKSSVASESTLSNFLPKPLAKFEPGDGECLFFIGQDLGAVGGLEHYSNGYCDIFAIPAGVTVYTGFSPGTISFGFVQKGNDGLRTKANWGAGDNCAQFYLEDPTFQHSMIAIGLSMVDHEKKVANGEHDALIRDLGMWIKESERPIFLRIGYEFDGWDWNRYSRKHYLKAWLRIHDIFDEMEVDNVAFVWQSKGTGTNQEVLEQWYPGDELVDWCGYSFFSDPDEEMLTFARRHKKPVFIAEATPVLQTPIGFDDARLSNPESAKNVWDRWFVRFIDTLNDNKDVIKAFSYINVDWPSQPMWANVAYFNKVDSRIQESEFVTRKWLEEISHPRYLKSSPDLWEKVGLLE